MAKLKKAESTSKRRINSPSPVKIEDNTCILFSFEKLERNEYFNLDGTCQNWSSDLFDILKEVSKIEYKRIIGKEFSGKHSTLRIHPHTKATPPCELPKDISLEDFCQIRISKRKGGIHGIFSDNIFYLVWFDPQHNMYPNENYGGLKKIKPPSTCCKERDKEIEELYNENSKLKEENAELWEAVAATSE